MRKISLSIIIAFVTLSAYAQNDSNYTGYETCIALLDGKRVEVKQEVSHQYVRKNAGGVFIENQRSKGKKTVLPPPSIYNMPYAYQNGDTIWDDQDTTVFNKIDNLSYERSFYYVKYEVKEDADLEKKAQDIMDDLTINQGWKVKKEKYKIVTTNAIYHQGSISGLMSKLEKYHEEGMVRIEQSLSLVQGSCSVDYPVVYVLGKQ